MSSLFSTTTKNYQHWYQLDHRGFGTDFNNKVLHQQCQSDKATILKCNKCSAVAAILLEEVPQKISVEQVS